MNRKPIERRRILAAVLLPALVWAGSTAFATLPVIDYSAVGQMIQQGLRQVQQYATEVSQLQTEINTYKNQIMQATGLAPAAQIWQTAQGTLGQLTSTVNMFRSGGALTSYLQNAQNINYWLSVPPGQYKTQQSNYWSKTQQGANEQMVQEISNEEQQIQADASILQRLQTQGGSVATQRQALDLANEMSALEQKSLLEIRTLLVSEQQALAAKNGAAATTTAAQQAATQQLFNSPNTYSDHTGWHP